MNKKIIFILIIAIVFQVGCNSEHARKDISKPIIAADTIASSGRAKLRIQDIRTDSLCFPCHSINMKYIGPALSNYCNSHVSFIKSYKRVQNNKFHRDLSVDTSYLKDVYAFVIKNSVICDTFRGEVH